MSWFSEILTKYSDSSNLDAFGNLRSSSDGNRFDLEFLYSNKIDSSVDHVLTGGATSVFNSASRDITLAINNTTTGTDGALYSHYDIPYTPGNSQKIDITGTLNLGNIGGGTGYVFLRSTVTGTTTDQSIDSTQWSGASTASLDFSKSQIFSIDFQSLKVGRIRFNLVRGGIPILAYQITNDNLRSTGYWQNPTLPIFWRIYNDATYTYMEMGYGDQYNAVGFRYRITKNASATMQAICATVKSEGASRINDMDGVHRSADNGTTSITVGTTLIPILSIRPRALYKGLTNRISSIIEDYNIACDNPVRIVVLYRPTLTGAAWVPCGNPFAVGALIVGEWYQIVTVGTTNYTLIGAASNAVGVSFKATGVGTGSGTVVIESSSMEYDTTSTAVSGGILIDSEYLSTSRNSGTSGSNVLSKTILSLGRSGTSDILTLAAIRTTITSSITLGSLDWLEIR